MSYRIRVVADGFSFLESPRWHEGRIWMSDFYAGSVHSILPGGEDLLTEATVAAQPSGLGWLPDGRLLIVSMRDAKLLRREADGRLVVHADLAPHVGGQPNDMVVDARGRAYVGEFGFDPLAGGPFRPARLLRVDPDGSVQVAASELYFPNGSVITDDGVLLVNETFGNRITAFDIEADGSLANRRVWAQFAPTPAIADMRTMAAAAVIGADGCSLDAEGALWVADAFFGRVVRVRAGGEIADEIKVAQNVFACMLGGADGNTLFLCEAPDPYQHARQAARESRLSAVSVKVGRAGRP